MNIDSTNINPSRPDNTRSSANKADPVSRSGSTSSGEGTESSSTADSVSLSDSAKTLTQVEATLKSAPDVDLAKVGSVKARVDSGEYSIDNDNLAQKLLDIES